MSSRLLILFGWLVLFSIRAVPAAAYESYDIDALGVPKFVNTNYIDLNKITQISKFRSSAGHDYHDEREYCRSMKHYFIAPDSTTTIRAPVSGTISRMDDDFVGKQVRIASDVQPAFEFIIFHVALAKPLVVGDRVEEGQVLGTHYGTVTFSDIAVAVNTPKAYRLVSYFETLTDDAFAAFQARGIASREDMIVSQAARNAEPYQCAGQTFINLKVAPEKEYVSLTGPTAAQQTITITQGFPPTTLYLANSPVVVSATSSSGLPVTIFSNTAATCATEGMSVVLLASGTCVITFVQVGDANTFETSKYLVTYIYDGVAYSGLTPAAADVTNTSFIRFLNTGSVAGTAKVNLRDSVTGESLGQWTSPAIPGYSEQQFYIGDIDIGLARRAPSYTLSLQSDFTGSFQNVFFRGPDGALTNGTVCAQGIQTEAYWASGVHSSLLPAYPSTVMVNNTSDAAKAVELTVIDARDGKPLGTYTTPVVPGHGRLPVSVGALEGAVGKPSAGLYHYVVRTPFDFTGYLQHIVTNLTAGITTDLTASCNLDGTTAGYASNAVRFGRVSASIDTEMTSTLRIINQSPYTSTATVTVWDEMSGRELGQWVSPGIGGGAGRDFSMTEIESALTFGSPRPLSYAMSLQSDMYMGAVQHVTTRTADGAVASQSLCANTANDPTRVFGVHSSKYSVFPTPSAIVVTNRGNAEQTVSLGIYDMYGGNRLGTYTTDAIPPRGQRTIEVAMLEAGARIAPQTGDLYTVKVDGAFTGFLQHVIYNQNARITADASAYCGVRQTVPTAKLSVATSSAGNGSGTITVNPSSGPFNYGANINVTATPAPGSALVGWAGDCASISARLFYMSENKTAVAVFGLAIGGPSHFVLNIGTSVTDGIGGTITSATSDINCMQRGLIMSGASYLVRTGSCATVLSKNTVITLTATPVRGSKFVSWSAHQCAGSDTEPTCRVTMNQSRFVSATFAPAD